MERGKKFDVRVGKIVVRRGGHIGLAAENRKKERSADGVSWWRE